MRIYELLVEEQEDNSELIAKYIARNCKPFLKQVDDKTPPLYRGQSVGLIPVCDQLFKSSTRENRQPITSSIKDHVKADEWFLKTFGTKFRSNHIIFASGDKWMTVDYGKRYILIPIGDFKFCWSPNVDDFFVYVDDNYDMKDNMGQLLKKAKYQVTDLNAAIESYNEVMIHCKEYFLLDVTENEYPQIINMAKGMK